MDKNMQKKIGLARYAIIAPLVTGSYEEGKSLSEMFKELSGVPLRLPDGRVKNMAPATIEGWYRKYLKGGFDALVPADRSDLGRPRKLDSQLMEKIQFLHEKHPRISATMIYCQMIDDGDFKRGEVSLSTVTRYIRTLEAKPVCRDEMRRYEREHINEVWCCDTCHGPYISLDGKKKQKVYIIAIIDDASRMIVGADLFTEDTYESVMTVIKGACGKYGIPKVLNLDNGASYKNKQMSLMAARLGTVLNYNPPYTPTGKAKIERWFRTMRNQWESGLDMNDYKSIDELRKSFFEYLTEYNLKTHSSLDGKSPHDRFFLESETIRRKDKDKLDDIFLLEVERTVTVDCCIHLENCIYETTQSFAGRKVTVRYTPDREKVYIEDAEGTLTPVNLIDKNANSHVKRNKVRITENTERGTEDEC